MYLEIDDVVGGMMCKFSKEYGFMVYELKIIRVGEKFLF